MVKIACINCGHTYRVKDDLTGKTVKCPHCRMAIRVGLEGAAEVSDDVLRAEVMRLVGAPAEPRVPQAGPEEQVEPAGRAAKPERRASAAKPEAARATESAAEPAEEEGARVAHTRKDYTALIVGVVVLMVAAVAGVVVFGRWESHKRQRQLARQAAEGQVRAALAAARAVDAPCKEDDAIGAWERTRSLAEQVEQEYGGGAFLAVITEAGQRVQNLNAAREKRRADNAHIKDLWDKGQREFQEKNYKQAKDDLEIVVALAKGYVCADDDVQQIRASAEALVNTDDVQKGSRGWVLHDGEWMSAAERDELVRKAKVAEMEAKGLVLFEGRWITPDEREKLLAERDAARERARWLAAEQQKVQEQLAGRADEVILDSCADRLRWAPESWANPVELGIEDVQAAKAKFARAALEPGSKGKWVVSMFQSCNIQDYDELKVDFLTAKPVQVALGVWTLPGRELYESRPITLQAGQRDGVSFPLKGKGFKSRASGWLFSTEVQEADKVYMLSLFFYSDTDEPVRFKNVRLVRAQKPAEPASK